MTSNCRRNSLMCTREFCQHSLADGRRFIYSPMGDDCSPMGFSWEYNRSKSIIRFAFEPYGPPGDRFAQSRMTALVHEIAQLSGVEVNLELFDTITQPLWVNPENEASILANFPVDPKTDRRCHTAIGFDLLADGSITIKAYVITQSKTPQAPKTQSNPAGGVAGPLNSQLSNPKIQN